MAIVPIEKPESVSDLADKVRRHQETALLSETSKRSPVRSLWMSQVGHPCERFLVLKLLRWQDELPFPIHAMKAMRAGKEEERIVNSMLQDMGFTIELQQQPVELVLKASKYLKLSGKIEGALSYDQKTWTPYETKTFRQYAFQKINSLEDIVALHWFYERYRAQLMLYMLGKNCDEMLLLVKCRGEYDIKPIPVTLDYDYASALWEKAERVAANAEAETLPDTSLSEAMRHKICPQCSFFHICKPDLPVNAPDVNEQEMLPLLQERSELREAHLRYQRVDKELKEPLKGKPECEFIMGEWLVKIKKQTRKEVPKEIREKYGQLKESTRIDFEFLGEQ